MTISGRTSRLGRSLVAWAIRRPRGRTEEPKARILPGAGARLHVVHEATDGRVTYLGFRLTDDPDPDGFANLGHVHALVRASADLLDPLGGITAYLGVDGGAAFRWRLLRRGPGTDPVLTEGWGQR